MKRIFPLWIEEKEVQKIKKKATKQNRSMSNYILTALKEVEKTPNLATGDWWDNADELKAAAKELKKEYEK